VGVVVNPSSHFVDEGIPFVHGTDVREGFIDTTELKYISSESNKFLAKSMLRRGDVVAMRVGYPGRSAVVTDELDGANCASVLIFHRSDVLHSVILSEFLNSSLGRLQIEAVQYGAAQGVMNVSDAVNLMLPIPPKGEQKKLAEELVRSRERVRSVIESIERQEALLLERRRVLITAAVTGQLDVFGVAA
jgi:type I restriction enzyme S subunit